MHISIYRILSNIFGDNIRMSIDLSAPACNNMEYNDKGAEYYDSS